MKELASKNLFADPHSQLLPALYPKCHPGGIPFSTQPLSSPEAEETDSSRFPLRLRLIRSSSSSESNCSRRDLCLRLSYSSSLDLDLFRLSFSLSFASFILAPRVSHRYGGATACIYVALFGLLHLLSRGVGMNGGASGGVSGPCP